MSPRVASLLLVILSALSAQVGPSAMAAPPSLPVITKDVLLGEECVAGMYRAREKVAVFDTWEQRRHRVKTLMPGESITLLSGISEVRKPDLVLIMSAIPELGLNVGDRLLRYTERGEGNADFWAHGQWYPDADLWVIHNAGRERVSVAL